MNRFREELIQVAAVAVAIITDLDHGQTGFDLEESQDIWNSIFHNEIFNEVRLERQMQEIKWGSQHHTPFEWLAILGEEYGEACQAAVDAHQWEGS